MDAPVDMGTTQTFPGPTFRPFQKLSWRVAR